MKCEKCHENEATIIAIQVNNGKPQEIHICEKCANESSSNDFAIPISFQDFFQGILNIIGMGGEYNYYDENTPNKEIRCDICGMTYGEFKNTGKLGCEHCYKTFTQLDTLLKNMQGSNKHVGKIPSKGRVELISEREIYNLKQQLAEAIKVEEYEQAAKLRDKIREIEKGE